MMGNNKKKFQIRTGDVVDIATLAPVVTGQSKEEEMAAPHETMHFISLELNNNHQLLDKIEMLQDQLTDLYGERYI